MEYKAVCLSGGDPPHPLGLLAAFCHSMAIIRRAREEDLAWTNLGLGLEGLGTPRECGSEFYLSKVSIKTINHYQDKV